MFSKHMQDAGVAATIVSRGLAAPIGRRPHPLALEVANQNGIPISSDKRAAAVSLGEIRAADAIFIMDEYHRREMRSRYPIAQGKTFLLGHWASEVIDDPVSLPKWAFERAWEQSRNGVLAWMPKLKEVGLIKE